MIRAPAIAEAASIRANVSLRPRVDSSAGRETSFGAACDACSNAIRPGAIRPFRVICADMPSTITTTNERKLPRPSNTSARTAAVGKHHAEAEQQSAGKHQRRRELRLQIDRFAEIDEPARGEKLCGCDRNAERQRVGPNQAAVAVGPPAAQPAEQAKAAQQADRAIGETDHQSAHYDNVATILHWFSLMSSAAAMSATA